MLPSQQSLRPGERVFAVVLVVLSVFVFSQAYAISGFNGLTTGGVMPMVASALMVISSVFILAETFRRTSNPTLAVSGVLTYLLPLRVVVFSGLVAMYAWSIPLLGFVAASAAFLFVTIGMLWRNKLQYTLVITCLAIAAIHFLFRTVFQVVLPAGTLWQ